VSPSAYKTGEGSVLRQAAWHSLAWLVLANLIGVWLGILLLVPSAGSLTGSWSYGRWMPAHLNFQLYGWISLPLVAWLLKAYGADSKRMAPWSRAALILWSLALMLGGLSWLNGHSSGKLFLDWQGFDRVFFPMAILFLWFVLAASLAYARQGWEVVRVLGLAALLPVPFLIFVASSPSIYPPVNPDSGGPTGASQLESVLVIVFLLFLLPYGLTQRRAGARRWIVTGWIVLAIEALLCLALGRQNVSHHRPTQFVSLGSLLIWIALIPAYYNSFAWRPNTKRWRTAVLLWWAVLVPTGWSLFLPGVLDHFKFTDGLVGHSLMAMAGFVTSLLVLILVVLLGEDGDVFGSAWAFYLWQCGTAAYVALMLAAGWIEGNDPAFTSVPSAARNGMYLVRLLLGGAMTIASCNWLFRLSVGAIRGRQAIESRRLRYADSRVAVI
jgi:cytochrome c oxidase cbb3-type subunit 1